MVFDEWGQYLHTSEMDHAIQLTDTEIAFLSLFSEKYQSEIYPTIQKKVYDCFFYYYVEETQEINIALQGINVQDVDSGDWQIHFEDDTRNPLVIVDFKKWKFSDITLVG
jgi:hypothetical protein